jgi:hypothetical protein
MKNLNEVMATLKAQMNEIENMFNNQKQEEITFTMEELIEYTKTIAGATANGMVYEMSQIDKFNFKPALFTVRENGELVVKVSRTKVINEIINNIDLNLNDDNIEDTINTVLDNMEK